MGEVKKLAESGRSVREIAEMLDATYHTVYQFSLRHGIETVLSGLEVGRQKKLTRFQIDEIVRRARARETRIALATEYGVSLGTIQWHIRRAKKTVQSNEESTASIDRQILATITRLARRFGTTTDFIAERLIELHKRA